MAAAPSILPPCLLKIPFDVCWLRRADINMLLVEVSEEMAGYVDTPTRSPHSISFLFEVIA
jgi:hypothetical protein